MAAPLKTAKQSVNLAAGEVRVSKIRRDPPPKLKEIVVRDRDEQNRMTAAVGIITLTLSLIVILIAVSSWAGWTPRQYTIRF